MRAHALASMLVLSMSMPVFAAVTAQARDLHFSADGDDAAGDGSEARPWRSIDKANTLRLVAGDRVLFAGGQTFSGNLSLEGGPGGTPESPIEVGSYGQGRATIESGEGPGISVKRLGGIRIARLVVRGAGSKKRGDAISVMNDQPGAASLSWIRIIEVEAVDSRNGILVGGWRDDGALSGYRDVRIERCLAHGNQYVGITTIGAEDPQRREYANADVSIVECVAHDNPGDPDYRENHSGNGILLGCVSGGLIDRCVAYGNGAECHCDKGGPVGIWAYASTRVTIQHSESYDNRTGCPFDGGGFDFDGGVSDSVMQYNYSHGNDGAGYLLYAYPGSPYVFARNVCRFNLSRDDGRKNGYPGIEVAADGATVSDIDVYNNTVVMSPSARDAPSALIVRNTARVRFLGNLLACSGVVPSLRVSGPNPGLTFLGNDYWADGQLPKFDWDGAVSEGLEAWRAASGQESAHGADTGLSMDPRFAAPAAPGRAGLRLAADSPLRGRALEAAAGMDVGPTDGFGVEIHGRARGIGADAGP